MQFHCAISRKSMRYDDQTWNKRLRKPLQPLHGVTTSSDAAMWPLQLSLIQKNTTLLEAAWTSRTAELAAVPVSPTVGVGGGPVSLCVMLTSTISILCNSTGRPSARERAGVPPHLGFHLDPVVGNHVTRKLSKPWYNWNSFRWREILRKVG